MLYMESFSWHDSGQHASSRSISDWYGSGSGATIDVQQIPGAEGDGGDCRRQVRDLGAGGAGPVNSILQ